jgi:hypothetical protein
MAAGVSTRRLFANMSSVSTIIGKQSNGNAVTSPGS